MHNGFAEGISKEEWFERNKVFYNRLMPTAERCGVNVLCENSTASNMGDRYFINTVATRIVELAPDRDNGMIDYPLEDYDDAFTEYMRLRELRKAGASQDKATQRVTDSKLDYEEKKRQNAERRSMEKKIERAKAKIAELEAELEKLEEELFGSAASDYKRAAEIDQRKCEIEEELLELYELTL